MPNTIFVPRTGTGTTTNISIGNNRTGTTDIIVPNNNGTGTSTISVPVNVRGTTTITLPVNGSAAPTIQQSVRPQPLNDIKSEWTRSMVHMQGHLDNMNNLLSELTVLLGQLKILLGDQAPTGFNEVIEAVDSTKDSRNKLAVEAFKLQNTFSRCDIDAARGTPGASKILDKTKEILGEFSKGTLESSQPFTLGNTQGRPNPVSRSQQSSGVNSGVTNSPYVYTPPAPPISGVDTQTAASSTANTQPSGASSNPSTLSTTTAQTSNASTQSSASNTATQTLPLSSTNSGTSTTATNTANTQAKGVASKPSSKGGTSSSVSGVTTAATGGSSNASAGKSASLTINANLSADKKFVVYEKADDFNKNMEISHKKSIKFLEKRVNNNYSFNIIGNDSKERKDLNFVFQNEIQANGSEISENQLIVINNFIKGEIISTGQEAQLRLVLRNRMERLNKEIKKLSS